MHKIDLLQINYDFYNNYVHILTKSLQQFYRNNQKWNLHITQFKLKKKYYN